MKNSITPIALASFFFCHMALANETCTVLGVHEPHTNIYDGPTWCEQVRLSDLTVRGPLCINQSRISGPTSVSGPVKASDTMFSKVIMENNGTPEILRLKSSTVVKEDVLFKGLRGKVIIDSSSKVLGHIINGDVVHQ